MKPCYFSRKRISVRRCSYENFVCKESGVEQKLIPCFWELNIFSGVIYVFIRSERSFVVLKLEISKKRKFIIKVKRLCITLPSRSF